MSGFEIYASQSGDRAARASSLPPPPHKSRSIAALSMPLPLDETWLGSVANGQEGESEALEIHDDSSATSALPKPKAPASADSPFGSSQRPILIEDDSPPPSPAIQGSPVPGIAQTPAVLPPSSQLESARLSPPRQKRRLAHTSDSAPPKRTRTLPPLSSRTFPRGAILPTHTTHGSPRADGRDAVRLADVLGPPAELQLAIVASFGYDPAWLGAHFARGTPVVVVSPAGREARASAKAGGGPVVERLRAPLGSWVRTCPEVGFGGCFHMKYMVLVYESGRLRVVVSTANLLPIDWSDLENAVFIQDVFPVSPGRSSTSKGNGFATILQTVLLKTNAGAGLEFLSKSMDLPIKDVSDISTMWDWNQVKAELVPSFIGKWQDWKTIKEDTQLKLECQGSSIGVYTTQWFNQFYTSACGDPSALRSHLGIPEPQRKKLAYPANISVVFPTQQTVNDAERRGATSMFCTRKKWEARNFPRDAFWDSRSRGGRMILAEIGSQGVRLSASGWVYLGSHNFTSAAWGNLSGTSNSPVLNINNFELGVVIPMQTQQELEEISAWERPPRKYGPGDLPWKPETGRCRVRVSVVRRCLEYKTRSTFRSHVHSIPSQSLTHLLAMFLRHVLLLSLSGAAVVSVAAQDLGVPLSWRKFSNSRGLSERIQIAQAAINQMTTVLDASTGEFAGIGYWQSGNVWSVMANQDYLAKSTVNKALVLNNLNLVFNRFSNYDQFGCVRVSCNSPEPGWSVLIGTVQGEWLSDVSRADAVLMGVVGHGGDLCTPGVRGALSIFKFARGWGLKVIQDATMLSHAVTVWNHVRQFVIQGGGTQPNKNFPIQSACNGVTMAGAVFWRPTIDDSGINSITTGSVISGCPFELMGNNDLNRLSAFLAEATGNSMYTNAAVQSATWIKTQMINSNQLVLDGMSARDCSRSPNWIFTYNTGKYIEGLSVLGAVTKDSTWTNLMINLLNSAVKTNAWQGSNGVITEGANPSSDNDNAGFKSVLIRGLAEAWLRNPGNAPLTTLIHSYGDVQYNALLDLAATGNTYSSSWAGPPQGFTAWGQMAALDVLTSNVLTN
ncbi:unnamed protein product [Mycena citricolor]|uniref:PLD phosphodiesterase domain-containing protein n=1 Tax=Mycena citricolor TaxID=2018698 RepID=A0AAD2HEJ0_9AGAR|nr:unnamed protein product [Mycena citricolor]